MSAPSANAPSTDISEQALGWLRTMLLIRRFEERAEQLTMRGKIPGGVHPALGKKRRPWGSAAALTVQDTVSAPHRGHHHALAKGMSPMASWPNCTVRRRGIQGRGGSMHLAGFDIGFIGSNGIVGAAVGIALGTPLRPSSGENTASQLPSSATVASTRSYLGVPQSCQCLGAAPGGRVRKQSLRRGDRDSVGERWWVDDTTR